jgi:hypothetical protein
MSACAGSLTKIYLQVHLLRSSEQSGRKRPVLKHFAGQVRMDRVLGRIGFMSTQRRENRWRRTGCTRRIGLSENFFWGAKAQCGSVNASGGTAPPGIPAWLATNSLHLGYRTVQLVLQDLRHSSPPFGTGPGGETGTPATHGSSLPHISSPSCLTRLHPTLPQVPAGECRWAERYDGKRNLHLQHAA